MRGRGTRTAPHINKQKFVIYDFLEIMNTLTILILIFLPEREQVIYRAAIASR
jgi:type I site-specific restriction endonuclease